MKISGNRRSLRVALTLALILVSWFVCELIAKMALHVFLGVNDDNYAKQYRDDPKLKLITWMEGYAPHPYFGYESSTTRASEQLLSEIGDNDFVIGILGGSVAGLFAEYSIRHPSRFESLRDTLPTFGRKTLRIVNLTNGGFKQPQQFFVAAYFMDKLDLVVNIDGFNDANPSHLLPVYPLEFPAFPQFYGRADHGGVYSGIGRTARWAYKKLTHAPLKIPGLSRSSLYFLGWYSLRNLLYHVVRASEAAYYASAFEMHQTEALRNTTPTEFIRKRIAIWKKYTILEDDLVRKRTGTPVFFFLQPNQYLKNSKPFSEQEKQVAVDSRQIEGIHERMILLKAAAQDLRRSEVPMFDLTGIFSETKETVYKDDCCHLNDRGNQIMADAIVSTIRLYARKALH